MQSAIILTAKVISDVVASLLAKLPEEEKTKMDKLQVTNEMKEKLQEKIAVIVKPAFTGKNTQTTHFQIGSHTHCTFSIAERWRSNIFEYEKTGNKYIP